MQVDSSLNATTSQNSGYNSATALQVRLQTAELMEGIELFLRGSKIIVEQDEKGRYTSRKVPIGKPKANDLGIQALLNYISSVVNPQVVQGNFPADGQGHSTIYENYVMEIHMSLAMFLVNNCYNWEVDDDDIDVIIDFMMALVIPFMTRLIDNKERESYENTVRHVESSTVREPTQQQGFKLF